MFPVTSSVGCRKMSSTPSPSASSALDGQHESNVEASYVTRLEPSQDARVAVLRGGEGDGGGAGGAATLFVKQTYRAAIQILTGEREVELAPQPLQLKPEEAVTGLVTDEVLVA